MASTQIFLDVYHFDITGNVFVRRETQGIPLPATFMPSPGPNGANLVKSKIFYHKNGPQIAYVGQTIEELNALIEVADTVQGDPGEL